MRHRVQGISLPDEGSDAKGLLTISAARVVRPGIPRGGAPNLQCESRNRDLSPTTNLRLPHLVSSH